MLNVIIDEWLWHHLGETNSQYQKDAVLFLRKIIDKKDTVVAVYETAFVQKCFAFFKSSEGDLNLRKIVKLIKSDLLYNSDLWLWLNQSDLQPLDPSLEAVIKPDDRYLVQAYLFIENDVILVTTDGPLLEALSQKSFNCQSRDIFLSKYLV